MSSKMNAYLDQLNEALRNADWNSVEDPAYQKELEAKMVETFEKIYGGRRVTAEMCQADAGMVSVPAYVRFRNGRVVLALLVICVQDQGEHWDTTVFLNNYGPVHQDDFGLVLPPEIRNGIFPYKYRPLVTVVGDIHTQNYF